MHHHFYTKMGDVLASMIVLLGTGLIFGGSVDSKIGMYGHESKSIKGIAEADLEG